MSTRLQTHAQTASTPSFTPVRTGLLQRKCACGGTPGLTGECAECRNKRLSLQRRSTNGAEPAAVPPIVHEVLRSPGQPLDSATRAFMEPRFGHNFSRVRVHTDAKAAESARAVNALAYTVGRDVVFGAGQYAPGTSEGQRLLAHELTHTSQQMDGRQGLQGKLEITDPRNKAEQEAEKASHVIMQGRSFAVTWQESPQIARQDPRERSRQSRPRNPPRGTRPIDQSGLDREDIHKIKDGIGAGPRDWVGITPEGEVITTDEEGNAENHGPADSYLRESHPEIPDWVWGLVGFFVVVAIIACFATGVCEFAAVVAGLSYAAALLIIALLEGAGIRDSGGETTAAVETQSGSSEEMA